MVTLAGAVVTKLRPAVIIASEGYLRERPDVLLGILTSKMPFRMASTDYALKDWQAAGLKLESCFRVFVNTMARSEITVIGRLTERDWAKVKECTGRAFALLGPG